MPITRRQISKEFQRRISEELQNPLRDTVAILALDLGCPDNAFSRVRSRLMRETIALLPPISPSFRSLEVRSKTIFLLICGAIPALVSLVDDTYHSLIVLEAKYPEHLKFCMSLTVAKKHDNPEQILKRAEEALARSLTETK